MEQTSQKAEIERAFSSVRAFSYSEKRSPFLDENRLNSFLDAVLDFKNSVEEKTKKLDHFNERIEKLTWFNDLDEECLMLLNDLISSAKDLHSSLIRQYVLMNNLIKKGIAKNEIKNFKNSIDELKEAYQDLESVYFFLPEIPGFVDTTKQLSLL